MRDQAWVAGVLAAAAAMSLAATGSSVAAGFAIKEQSPAALGNAFAGATAEAGDISYMFFNPAGLTRHDGTQALSGISYIAPRSEPGSVSGSTIAGVPIGGGSGGGDISENAFVPVLYGMHSLSDRLKLGVGLNAPFGLETDYEPGWAGRYHALNSQLTTINLNPAVAYRVTERVSLGAGLQVQYVDTDLSNAIDFGSIGALAGIPGAVPTQQDGRVEVEGDDIGVGFNLGALVSLDSGTRLGFAYRSQVAHSIEGDADFRLDSAGVGAALRGATGQFTDTGAQADLTLPDMLSFGVYHEITPQWAIMAEAQYTRWSKFDDLVITFDNPAQDPSLTEENWEDVWFGAVGVTYRPQPALALRFGVAYDESPIPDSTRTPRIPANDRQWVAIGASYEANNWLTVDAGYTHIFVDDSRISLDAGDPGNTFRGDLDASFDNAIDIATIQAIMRF